MRDAIFISILRIIIFMMGLKKYHDDFLILTLLNGLVILIWGILRFIHLYEINYTSNFFGYLSFIPQMIAFIFGIASIFFLVYLFAKNTENSYKTMAVLNVIAFLIILIAGAPQGFYDSVLSVLGILGIIFGAILFLSPIYVHWKV